MIRALVVGALVAIGCGGDRAVPAGCEPLAHALRSASNEGRDLIAEIDAALEAAREVCREPKQAARGAGIARELARSRLAEPDREAALAELRTATDPAIALRRAELLDGLGKLDEALAALEPAIADPAAQAHARTLRVARAAATDAVTVVESLIGAAPLPERPALALRAVAIAPDPARFSSSNVPELVAAAADHLERERGPVAALDARETLVRLEPEDADHWDALGRSRIARQQTTGALAAWDRAHELAPAQPTFVLAPIKALIIANEPVLARKRAAGVAARARTYGTVERLETASSAAAIAGDTALALALAREAHAGRPTDGKLVFLVGQRLAEAGDVTGAANAYAELLVCGAHGRPWHRHEVAAKLVALGDAVTVASALSAKRGCSPVDPEDLERYLATLRATP